MPSQFLHNPAIAVLAGAAVGFLFGLLLSVVPWAPSQMRTGRQRLAAALTTLRPWGVPFIVGLIVVFGLIKAPDATVKLIVGVVAAAAGIIVAIQNYAFTRQRDQELEQRRRMEDNYKKILERLADFIREQARWRDEILSANLSSWVVGSSAVVQKTINFLNSGKDGPLDGQLLRELLLEMWRDLGLDEGDLQKTSLEILFPPSIYYRGLKTS